MKNKILMIALVALLLVGTVMARTAPEVSAERTAPRPVISAIAIPDPGDDPAPRRQSTTNSHLNRVVWANQDQWYTKTVVDGLLCWEDIGMCIVMVTPVTR